MLSQEMTVRHNGLEVGCTPLLVPSISSRANIDVGNVIETIRGTIRGPLLISAYDVYNTSSFPEVDFSDLLFMDSGGYECAQDQEVADIGLYRPDPLDWSVENLRSVLDAWNPHSPPTVAISYDHPTKRCSIAKQIESAKDLLADRKGFVHELLLKPEGSRLVDLREVCSIVEQMECFDIIGFTEKELGNTVIERMMNLARVKLSMKDAGVSKPIHVFGSLDPITTPLYFLSGADIFDGLAWLRFSFSDSGASYIDSLSPKKWGIDADFRDCWVQAIVQNYVYLLELRLKMIAFSRTGDFSKFGLNGEFFRDSYERLEVKMGDVKP